MYNNEKEIREYIEQIRGLCDKVIESLDAGEYEDLEYDSDETQAEVENKNSNTQLFGEMQKSAQESIEIKKLTTVLDSDDFPYLVRKSTGEKIIVNRNIFKMGKEKEYVDYCINDNATISRSHADILRKSDGYYIKDLGSLNHTFVNGVKLEKDETQKLEDGCLVQLANEVFEWHAISRE
jgi:pSer/pThr/pTyr-binding forkhead associated (FHA) protein